MEKIHLASWLRSDNRQHNGMEFSTHFCARMKRKCIFALLPLLRCYGDKLFTRRRARFTNSILIFVSLITVIAKCNAMRDKVCKQHTHNGLGLVAIFCFFFAFFFVRTTKLKALKTDHVADSNSDSGAPAMDHFQFMSSRARELCASFGRTHINKGFLLQIKLNRAVHRTCSIVVSLSCPCPFPGTWREKKNIRNKEIN